MAEEVNNQREERVKEIKDQLRPLIKRANQRILRLEQDGLTQSPAYQKLTSVMGLDREKPRFKVGGKSLEDLIRSSRDLNVFLDYKTSTVGGTKQTLSTMAENIGLPYYENTDRLVRESATFFRLADRVQEYYKTTNQNMQYQEVWTAINEAEEIGSIGLTAGEADIGYMADKVIAVLDRYEEDNISAIDDLENFLGNDWTEI